MCCRPKATALLVRKLKPVENKLKSSDPCPRSWSCYLNRPSGPHWPVWPVSSGPCAICLTPLPLWGEPSWRPHSLRLHICRFVFNSGRFLWCFMFPCFRKRSCLHVIEFTFICFIQIKRAQQTHSSTHKHFTAAPPHILDFRFKDMKKLRCNTCSTKTRVYYSLDRLISTFTLSTVLRYFYYWCFTWKFKYICLNISILCLKKKEKSTLKKSF